MTKKELRVLIKECVSELIKENQYPKAGLEWPDEPEGEDNKMMSSDDKINKRLASWRDYDALVKFGKAIHDEPSFQAALKKVQQRNGDLPLDGEYNPQD
jgi:hypothetical protein